MNILSLLLAIWLVTSCSHNRSVSDIISEGFHLLNEKKYDEAQLKALQAEELINGDSPLNDRESLVRLYGLIYYQQNIKDKARDNIQLALKYAMEMNDTSLIIINFHNLGLCAKTGEEAIPSFEQASALAQKSGSVSLQTSALEKLAQAYISSGNYTKAQQILDEANGLCENNSIQQIEIAITQCRLWFAEGKYDSALQGYKSIKPDSLNVYGHLLRTRAIHDILVLQEDYKNALAYKDSVYIYTDSIKSLDGSRQVKEIEMAYHANIERKNRRFQILMWTAFLLLIIISIILFFTLNTLRLKKRQIELNDKISALNARIVELMPNHDNGVEQKKPTEEEIDSMLHLIEKKYKLSLEVFKTLPQYESLRKLNLIRDISADNKKEVKSVYDAIVGRFSGCCADIRQAFPGLTNDDCVFCTMNFIGCSKEVISSAMGSSEEALRRRKSRIKQKIQENLFQFFFSK